MATGTTAARALLLLCAGAALAVADVVVYENDLSLPGVQGVEGHSWTIMDNNVEGTPKFVMEVQSMSGTGENSLSSMNNIMRQSDSVLGPGNSNDVFNWVNQQLNTIGDISNTLWVVNPMGRPQFFDNSPMFGSGDCQDVKMQMLQQVANERLRSAMSDAGLMDRNFLNGYNEVGQSDGIYELEVNFNPVVFDENVQSTASSDSSSDSSDDSSDTSEWSESSFEESDFFAEERRYNFWGRVLFITLIVGCFLTLLLIVKQGVELCRAMRRASVKVRCGGCKHYGDADVRQPLLSTLDPEKFEKAADNYPVVVVTASPDYSKLDQ